MAEAVGGVGGADFGADEGFGGGDVGAGDADFGGCGGDVALVFVAPGEIHVEVGEEAVVAVGAFVAGGEIEIGAGEGGLELFVGGGGGDALAGEADFGAAVQGFVDVFGGDLGFFVEGVGDFEIVFEDCPAHFALEIDDGFFGGEGGAGGGEAEALVFEFDADEIGFGHVAFFDAHLVVGDGLGEVGYRFVVDGGDAGGAGGGPEGFADLGGDALGEDVAGDGGEFFVGGGEIGTAFAFAGGFEGLGDVDEVVVIGEGAIGGLPAAAEVFELDREAGVGLEGGLFEEALGGGDAAIGGGEEGVLFDGFADGRGEGEWLLWEQGEGE